MFHSAQIHPCLGDRRNSEKVLVMVHNCSSLAKRPKRPKLSLPKLRGVPYAPLEHLALWVETHAYSPVMLRYGLEAIQIHQNSKTMHIRESMKLLIRLWSSNFAVPDESFEVFEGFQPIFPLPYSHSAIIICYQLMFLQFYSSESWSWSSW